MNGLLLSATTWKFRCLQAYLHRELLRAEKLNSSGDAKECVNDNKFVLSCLDEIVKVIEKNNNTYEQITKVAKINPLIKGYYNSIEEVLNKHFKLEDAWIPSLLAIETFRIFSEYGYKDFEHINFLAVLSEYENYEDRKSNKIPTHMRCAEDLYKTLIQNKKRKGK